MKLFSEALLVITAAAQATSALSAAGWRSQSIYQVITDRFARTDGSTTAACDPLYGQYCGGTWTGIINHLDYIQNMGFTAIWISPVVKNMAGSSADGAAYHGYWAQDIYSLNSNFGTATELKALSTALHNRGMYLMVDVVTNHMGYLGCATCVDYSIFKPFNSASYYHPACWPIDYNNATSVTNCWEGDDIVSLPDLRTENANVAAVWNSWITALVANYSIDGLRVDSAQQTGKAFFPAFQTAAGVYTIGEVYNGDSTYVCPYQTVMNGVLNYPVYFAILAAFKSTTGSISGLVNSVNTMTTGCSDTTLLGSFLENHDVARFPSFTSDVSLTKNAIAFTILADGVPIIYQGQEQHYSGNAVPINREAVWLSGYSTSATYYTWIATLNQIRNQAIYVDSHYVTYKNYPVYSDASTIVMRKGLSGAQIIGVFTNAGASSAAYTLTLTAAETGFTASQALIEITACTAYTTDTSGNLAVAMASGLPRVFYPKARLIGSGICSALTASTTTTATVATPTACAISTSVAVTFDEIVTTVTGQTIKIVGNTTALGSWTAANGVALSASGYTAANPMWAVTLNLAPGTKIEYKFVNVASTGAVTWEADPNHVYVVPASCATVAVVSSKWQS